MGIIANAVMQGAGTGMQAVGQQIAMNDSRDADREITMRKLDQQRQEFLDKLSSSERTADMRWGNGAGGRSGGQQGDNIDPTKANRFVGYNDPDAIDPAGYQKVTSAQAVQDAVSTDNGQYTDAISRREAKTVTTMGADREGYEKARRDTQAANVDVLAKVNNPGQYKGLKEGEAQGLINDAIKRAVKSDDPQAVEAQIRQATEIAMATKGHDRFKVQGNTVIDGATGANKATAVGESVASLNESKGEAVESGTADKVQSSFTGSNGNRWVTMRSGTQVDTGVRSADFDKQAARLMADMEKNDPKFAKLPEADKQARVLARLSGNSATTGDNRIVKPAAPASAPTSGRSPADAARGFLQRLSGN